MSNMESNGMLQRESVAALSDRARAELKSGNAAEAIVHSDALIDSYPDEPQGFILKARALASEVRLAEALETLRAGLSHHAGDLKLLNMARNLALQTRGFDAAVEYADKLTELAPGDLKNRAFLVQYYSASKSFDTALAGADALLADFPNDALAWVLKIQVLLAQRRGEEALNTTKEALKTHADNTKLLALGRQAASLLGRSGQAAEFALRLRTILPDDIGNRVFLAAAAGDFSEILKCSEELIAISPRDRRGWIMKADALVAQHRVREALGTLSCGLQAIANDPRLLGIARNLAFAHGMFHEALDYALELLDLNPLDQKNETVLIRCWTATGADDAVAGYLRDAGSRVYQQPLRKAARNYREQERLKRTAPAIVAAWRQALDSTADESRSDDTSRYHATTIQYWSQGEPPRDVQLVISEWKDLLAREQIGDLQLFDRVTAATWIDANAPEFASLFSRAFHFAMEADIFRIAYASKRPCIYVDVDDWPLENTARTIKFCISERKSMLFFRSYKPWVSNGFFIATPDCPFFTQLVAQTLAINLDEWPHNRTTIGKTFGPARYNKVLVELVRNSASWAAHPIDGVPGCSRLVLDGHELFFSHEAAVAALKPPFTLGYKATDAYWKKMPGK